MLCVPDCGIWSLLLYKLTIRVVFSSKTRKKCIVASNWLRTKSNYQRKQGSPNSEGERISLGVSWSLCQKDFGGAYSRFYLEPAFHTAALRLPQQQESPVEMQRSELGHGAWLTLSPSETSGRPVVGVKYSNGMLQGSKCCCCCCLYAEQIGKKHVQLAVTSWGCLGQKAKSNMPMNLIPLLFTSSDF